MTQTRSRSIPDGLVVELYRCKVRPGASAEADRWMAMLNDRLEECVATLDRERMAIEIIFRLKENGEDYLFWMSVYGTGGQGGFQLKAGSKRHQHIVGFESSAPGETRFSLVEIVLPVAATGDSGKSD